MGYDVSTYNVASNWLATVCVHGAGYPTPMGQSAPALTEPRHMCFGISVHIDVQARSVNKCISKRADILPEKIGVCYFSWQLVYEI